MRKGVTMQQVADALGVTKVSVSKALNNNPGISDKLKREIVSMAAQMGYIKKDRPNQAGHSFAFITPKRFFLEDETFYTAVYYYISKRCMEKGYSLGCFVVNELDEFSPDLPQQLSAEDYDGFFIVGEFHPIYLQKLARLNAYKITIDCGDSELASDSVIIDHFYVGYEITNHLIKIGHRSIGFLGDTSVLGVCDRYFGYRKALTVNNLPFHDKWHMTDNDLPLPHSLPTAFLCSNDKQAFMLMQRLQMDGIRIPDEVSLIGFDNSSLCTLTAPHLTSVEIDCKLLAENAMERMLYRISFPDAPLQRSYIGCRLIERGSVKTLL